MNDPVATAPGSDFAFASVLSNSFGGGFHETAADLLVVSKSRLRRNRGGVSGIQANAGDETEDDAKHKDSAPDQHDVSNV